MTPTIRRATIALAAISLLAGAAPAQALDGWVHYRSTWIPYHYRLEAPPSLEGQALQAVYRRERAAGIRRAKRNRDLNVRELLREARAQIKAAKARVSAPLSATAPSAGVWGCVARWEEGGQNSVAGYFGTVYPPASYPEPGPSYARQYGNSWLDVPYAAQLQVAEAIQRAYGWSAWGPATRARCGLG